MRRGTARGPEEMPAREREKQGGASFCQPRVPAAYSCSGHYGIPNSPPPISRGTAGGLEETPARKRAKQGGAPTVNRMSLPRILVQGTRVFKKPPPMSRKAAGGPEGGSLRGGKRSKASCLPSTACLFLLRAYSRRLAAECCYPELEN